MGGGATAFGIERHQIPRCCKYVLTGGYSLHISSEIWITIKTVHPNKVEKFERTIWTVLKWLIGRGG